MDKIAIIGAGNMGEAMIKAFLKQGIPKSSLLCSEKRKDRRNYITKTYGIPCHAHPKESVKKANLVIIAVKPQDSQDVLRSLAPWVTEDKTIISIMAGITTSNIISILGKPVKILRIMPNICVKVGEGALGIASNSLAGSDDIEAVKVLFGPMGKVVEVGEELMDAVTALGGSGPAFLLLFIEAMIDGAVKLGIPRDKSATLAYQVIRGTISMLDSENLHPSLMREMITSPGGTTIAGLAVLEQGAFKGLVISALEAAAKRSKELSL